MMADQNHVAGGGGSGGQGDFGETRDNQDPAASTQGGGGEQESGAGYGNNAGVQGETADETDEAQR